MKNLILTLFLLTSINLIAQTNGISYQAVIVGPDNQELPGVDAENNILPNATVAIRFTIFDANNQVEYQEVQTTNTDQYGRINLLIGEMDPDNFAEISWDGTNKDLKVEIDFNGGTSYIDMAREKLTFLPYAYHRNITATGTLTVDDLTFLNGELQVEGPTNLNSTLNVNNENETNLSGELKVQGATTLDSGLDVGNTASGLIDTDAPTKLAGTLDVQGLASFKNGINVDGESEFEKLRATFETNLSDKVIVKGQTVISAKGKNGLENHLDLNEDGEPDGPELTMLDGKLYPLIVKGKAQGIAIMVEGINPNSGEEIPISSKNTFISFWDEGTETSWGRIAGVAERELENSDHFVWEMALKQWDVAVAYYDASKATLDGFLAGVELIAMATSSTACVGAGACVTTPPPSLIVFGGVQLVFKLIDVAVAYVNYGLAVRERIIFRRNRFAAIGVTYSSGAADYAEWLPKENFLDNFNEGEIVGIKNGKVSKNTWGADKIMIVSTTPIVIGNMPQQKDETNNVKIAFMGQVPVMVQGNVQPGDYILPDQLGFGFGRAVNPKDLKVKDYKKIAGVAWSVIKEINPGMNIVNVAVGININDLSEVVANQEEELKALKLITEELKKQIRQSDIVLSKLVPGFKEAISRDIDSDITLKKSDEINASELTVNKEEFLVQHDADDILYFEISNKQMEDAIDAARVIYLQMQENENINRNMFLKKTAISSDGLNEMKPVSIEDHPFWQRIDNDPTYKDEIIQLLQSQMAKAYHTHEEHAHKFTDLKLRKN